MTRTILVVLLLAGCAAGSKPEPAHTPAPSAPQAKASPVAKPDPAPPPQAEEPRAATIYMRGSLPDSNREAERKASEVNEAEVLDFARRANEERLAREAEEEARRAEEKKARLAYLEANPLVLRDPAPVFLPRVAEVDAKVAQANAQTTVLAYLITVVNDGTDPGFLEGVLMFLDAEGFPLHEQAMRRAIGARKVEVLRGTLPMDETVARRVRSVLFEVRALR